MIAWLAVPGLRDVTLIHNYIYREVLLLMFAVVGVLTFMFEAVDLFRKVQAIMYTDFPMWITAKLALLSLPTLLTFTVPIGLLAAVLIVFGRMSSDREFLAIKASGIGLAPIVAPVIIIAFFCSLLELFLVAKVEPKCREDTSTMLHDIVTSNPQALFTPQIVLDKIPGLRIYFDRKVGNRLEHVFIWQFDDQNHLVQYVRADRADVSVDLEHQQLLLKLYNERDERFPNVHDITKMEPGASALQGAQAVSLNSFYEKTHRQLAFMTLPEISEVIEAMQGGQTGELATPYLTELQARVSFSLACLTFVIFGMPLAIQTQRRETSIGLLIALGIVVVYWLLVMLGRALRTHTGFYPELIAWTPNIVFQGVGVWLFSKANLK